MENKGFAFHESMDTHEIMNFKTVCLLQSKMMQGIVFDQELRELMEKDVQQSIQDIKELREIYNGITPQE